MKKIVLINSLINPQCISIGNEINREAELKGFAFKVLFLSASDKHRDWGNFDNIKFDYEILKNIAIRIRGKDLYTFFINTSIVGKLNTEQPDKVICFGWDSFAAYASNWWAGKNKKEFVLWAGSTANEKSWRRTLFSPLVKYLIKKSDGYIAYGTAARDYLVTLGADCHKVSIYFNTINTDYFKESVENFGAQQKFDLKKKLGIQTSRVILFTGQLIQRKGVFELLKGFKLYQQENKDCSLLILGKGKEKRKMLESISKEEIENVFFADFMQYDQIADYYAISDLLILPSREEVWGLVINEAMACGLPVITTEETGAGPDLIEEGENGYIIKSHCPECIGTAIKQVFENGLDKKNTSIHKMQEISAFNSQALKTIIGI